MGSILETTTSIPIKMGKTLRRTRCDIRGKTAYDGKGGSKASTFDKDTSVPVEVREERRDEAFRNGTCKADRELMRLAAAKQVRHDKLMLEFQKFKEQPVYQHANCIFCNGAVSKWKTFLSSNVAMTIMGSTYLKPCICKRCNRRNRNGW